MKGYIDEYGQPMISISVNGLSIDAVVDTGFDSELCLPVQLAIRLGLKLKDVTMFELADGTIKREPVFFGSVKFGKETKDVGIILTESEDALIGTGMLSEYVLRIDFIRKEIEIG